MSKSKEPILIDESNESEVDSFISTHSLSEIFRYRRSSLPTPSWKRDAFPLEAIADLVGLTPEVLRKKIYQQRPMTRDCLIAICAAHGMDDLMTSKILVKNEMPGLDDNLTRDDAIIEALYGRTESELGTPLSAAEINAVLSSRGLPELVIVERKNKQMPKKAKQLPYRIMSECIQTYDNCDRFDSFATAYAFQYSCRAILILDCGAGRIVRMTLHPDGRCQIEDSINKEHGLPRFIDSESAAGELAPYYAKLKENIRKKLRELDSVLNDSRNYRGRISAKISNDRIHVFYEEYNYGAPETREYYLMEYVDRSYCLTIAHHSMFMQRYLSDTEYKKHYGTPDDSIICQYSSEEELTAHIEKTQDYYRKDSLKRRLSVYKRLQAKVSECLQQLRNKEKFVHNLDAIWDNPAEVLGYYDLEDTFDVIRDQEFGEIIHAKETAELSVDDGSSVAVSFDDICRAFQLGFENIAQICRVIRTQGSIESVLE